MRVRILSLTGETVRFLLEGVDVAFANALRRTMISEVPSMAVDDIFIFDNSSVVPDEVLAHRIGFVPLKTDLDSYVLPEKCECGSDLGCSLCRVVLTLDVRADAGNRTVTSGDFVSEDPKIVPASPDIPLTKLAPGQAVRLEGYARLGAGKTREVAASLRSNLPARRRDRDRRGEVHRLRQVRRGLPEGHPLHPRWGTQSRRHP
jgi:DNA-directed RNA polymerase subunit D